MFITEPYLGGGGSLPPAAAYLQMLQAFCRENDIVFILDEVQANFGRTGSACSPIETYGIEPDIVGAGQGPGQRRPGGGGGGPEGSVRRPGLRRGVRHLERQPALSPAVLATLDEFAGRDVMKDCHKSSAVIEAGLVKLKEVPAIC